MPLIRWTWLWTCIALLAGAAGAAPPALHESFDLQVPGAPASVRIEGRERVLYELHLTNFSAQPLRLRALDVRDAASGERVARFAGSPLMQRMARIGAAKGEAADAPIAPGARAVVYLDFDTDAGRMPARFAHTVTYAGTNASDEQVVSGPSVSRDDTRIPVLGPPVHGGPWVVIYDAAWPRGHRRVFYTLDGRARLPGRFATDWVRVDDAGRTTRGNKALARDALGHGAPVIAVADATVVAVRNDYAEHARVADNPKHALADASGNHVVLDLGGGRYAFYEHLRPGSVRVRAGQRVRRGQVLGELGFSGDSTGPHLHFHVADGPSPLAAEGRPFALESFRSLGRYDDLSKLGSARWTPRGNERDAMRSAELPAGNSVIDFGVIETDTAR